MNTDTTIRFDYVRQTILALYRSMRTIRYPIEVESLLPLLPLPCRIMDYEEMSKVAHCRIKDVIEMCGSFDGAANADFKNNRCLILYNPACTSGRILWTKVHEVGHIALGHIFDADLFNASLHGHERKRKIYEEEADYFVKNLLAPFPILHDLNIQNASQITEQFGLSRSAAKTHIYHYRKWCDRHTLSAWDNDMLRVYHHKMSH